MTTNIIFSRYMRTILPYKTNKTLHSHDYWQLDFIHKGNINIILENEEFTVNENQILLIKPNIKHVYLYNNKITQSNIKFSLSIPINFINNYILININNKQKKLLNSFFKYLKKNLIYQKTI